MQSSQVNFIRHSEIDRQKWDACIDASPYALIYNRSWFLDAVAVEWDALVEGDYEKVMPLPFRRKYGIQYVYQPYFMARCGITGPMPIDPKYFLAAIPKRFKYIQLSLNENNYNNADLNLKKRLTQQLNLSATHEEICKQYHRLATRMIKKSVEADVVIETDAPIDENFDFYRQQYPALRKIPLQAYTRMGNAFTIAKSKDQFISLAAKQNGRLIGMYMLLKDEKQVYSVIGGSSAEGKSNAAFYLLTDTAIRLNCNSARSFRFEGSDTPGISAFNRQFGAYETYYHEVLLNRLGFPFNLFKK